MDRTSISDALALYDKASSLDRLRFELRALHDPLTSCPPAAVSGQIHTLARIIAEVSDEITHRLRDGMPSPAAQLAVEAFSSALDPLGEAVTELGYVQLHSTLANANAPGTREHDLEPSHQADLIIDGLRSADSAFAEAAENLRKAATLLTQDAPRLQTAARARSPQASAVAPVNPADGAATSKPMSPPRTAHGR